METLVLNVKKEKKIHDVFTIKNESCIKHSSIIGEGNEWTELSDNTDNLLLIGLNITFNSGDMEAINKEKLIF